MPITLDGNGIIKNINFQHPSASATNFLLTESAMSINSASVINDLTINGGTLRVDGINNRVGIGTLSPQGIFDVASSGTTHMRIDSSGRIIFPNQPVFHAYGSTTQSWSGAATMKTVALNNTYVNVGSHFNTSTYIFTAPVAGNYMFFGRATTSTVTSSGPALLINKNNGAFAPEVAINYTNTSYSTFAGMIILTLAANDNIRLSITNYNNTSFTVEEPRCSLSGYLMS